jgi:hypothetical protein
MQARQKIASVQREVCVALRRSTARLLRPPLVLAALLAAVATCAAPAAAGPAAGEGAPLPHADGAVVEWSPVGPETSYEIAISTAPRERPNRVTTYVTVPRTQGEPQRYTPPVTAGSRAWIGISADGGLTWSGQEARITGASAPVGEAAGSVQPEAVQSPPPEGAGGLGVTQVAPAGPAAAGTAAASQVALTAPVTRIIGTNGGAGWGTYSATKILSHHITWDRVEVGSWSGAVSTSASAGFRLLGIVGNTEDGRPISGIEPSGWASQVVSQLRNNPSISIGEAGNEMYLKGGVANPAQYGRMYLAAVRAEHAAGIHVPLLFNMAGDYPTGSWAAPTGWSQDSRGGGWLHDAVVAVPGLAAAIAENGISIHPYGAPGQDIHDDWGAAAAAADEVAARAALGTIPPIYVTEFGYRLDACGTGWGACSLVEQASKLRAAYAELLADPHVAGIWWYESHDDSTGRFGYLSRSGGGRPAFKALTQIAESQGQ